MAYKLTLLEWNLVEFVESFEDYSFYDNESLLEGYSSSKNSFKDEFVVVPVPKCFVFDNQENTNEKVVKQPKENDSQNEERKETKPFVIQKGSLEQADLYVVQKPSLEQAGSSGTIPKKTSTEKVLNTAENNFDDNNNSDNSSRGSGNSIKLKDEDLDNIVVITVPKDEQVKEGFIYVHVDGQKVLIPKNILKSEVVNAAQELEKSPNGKSSIGVIVDSNEMINQTPTPSMASTLTGHTSHQSPEPTVEDENAGNTTDSAPTAPAPEVGPSQKQDNIAIDMTMSSLKDNEDFFEANNYMSHCSAAGSCYSEVNSQSERNKRLFIFPQNVPGYEVVHPVLDLNNPLYPNLTNELSAPPSGTVPSHSTPIPVNPFVEHVPNFQQTPPEQRAVPVAHITPSDPPAATQSQEVFECFTGYSGNQPADQGEDAGARAGVNQEQGAADREPAQVHILPDALVSGAVNVASSAISTARTMINQIISPPPQGRWVNGHWVSSSPQTPREANLQALAEMGFWNRDLNATLLARFNDDLNRVVAELVQ